MIELKKKEPAITSKKTGKAEAIIEAAQALFIAQGYEATTMAQVAARAGVAVGTVYLYFKNKAELLYALKSHYESRMVGEITSPEIQSLSHRERLRPLLEAVFANAARDCEMVQLMGLQPQMIGELKTRPAGSSPIQQVIQAFFQEAQASGTFRALDTPVAATICYGMVQSALHQCYHLENGYAKERYLKALGDMLEHWLFDPN